MNSAAPTNRFGHGRSRALLLALSLAFVSTMAVAGGPPPPTFTKAFLPATIGPGSVSMLVFTIDNSERPPAAMMAFDDELPFGMELAAPALVSNGCGGTVTLDEDDADSGFDVRLVDGMVGLDQSCEIVVNVTATTDCGGVFEGSSGIEVECANTSGDLTSSVGNSGPAAASLFVNTDRPGFSKSFGDMGLGVPFGGRTTLTLTIDNTASAFDVVSMSFDDNLPPGMVVANPANASTNCDNPPIPATLTAKPGESVISLGVIGVTGFPALDAGDTCTVTVDVIGGAVGTLGNVTDELLVTIGATQFSSGKAAAVLEVTGVEDLLELRKEFIDDPAAPGGTTTLEFTVTNKSRDDAAAAITFSDDLGATLEGLAPSGPLPTDPCGAGSSLSFTPGTPPSAVLTLTGGSLAPVASCTFGIELDVPPTAVPGSYPNTAGPVSGDVGGSPETGNIAGDLLFIVPFPALTKEFTPGTVAAGDSVTLEFTITNPASSAMTDIAFDDELTDNSGDPGAGAIGNGFLPFPVSVTIPPGDPCGAGSALALTSPGFDRQALSLTGGSLAAAGMAGDSCTFSVTVDIPIGLGGGIYLNTTEEISATVDAATVTGPPASDTLVVASAPQLTKEFTDDPVLPAGGPVTLEFNLIYDVDEGTPDATAIAFTDDLAAVLPGMLDLTAASVDTNTCAGAMVDISTPTLIAFSGGTLTAGESCTVGVTLTVPASPPLGTFGNTTSEITATIDGVATTNNAAEDDLVITPLAFSKEFLTNPVIPGDTTILRFTIENLSTVATDDATGIVFTDSLATALAGLAATGAPSVNTCGGTLSGTTFLLYTVGSLMEDSTCTIEVEVLVPAGADDGDYANITGSLTATIDGSPVTVDPATDVLTVDSNLLEITKEFTDDPVLPGGTANLEFTLTNLSDKAITGINFDDDLGAALTGLTATSPAVMNTCGGTATLPTSMFSYSGGSLDPMASCTIQLLLDVPDAPLVDLPPFLNTTSDVTGEVFAPDDVFGIGASDELEVQTITLEKAFTDDPTTATGTATLEFTLTNLGVAPVRCRHLGARGDAAADAGSALRCRLEPERHLLPGRDRRQPSRGGQPGRQLHLLGDGHRAGERHRGQLPQHHQRSLLVRSAGGRSGDRFPRHRAAADLRQGLRPRHDLRGRGQHPHLHHRQRCQRPGGDRARLHGFSAVRRGGGDAVGQIHDLHRRHGGCDGGRWHHRL
jgi:hypothetical protein